MKQFVFPVFFLLFVVTGQAVLAQSGDTKITTGVVAYNQQDFEKAITALNIGLEDPTAVKEKNLPKGFYYRGMSRINYMRQLAGKLAGAGADANPEEVLNAKEQEFMEGAVLGAYEDFKNAIKYDDGKWGKKVEAQMLMINAMVLQGGVAILNGTYDDKMTDEEKKEAYTETIKYMDASTEISPTTHLGFDLKGQAYLNLKDTTNAYKNFVKAGEVFQENSPSQPDQLIAYVFYRKALIERYANNDLDASLKSIDDGKKALDAEHNRYLEMKDNLNAQQIESINQQYTTAKEDLSRFELDILLNTPGKLKEAIAKFEDATKEEPNNYILHVAFAQLLEKVDMVKAEEVYKTATKIDPGKQIAWFNLGALYVNKGVEAYKEANNISDDFEKAKAMQVQGDNYYKTAFPYLEKSLEVSPCDGETLSALISICINLASNDESYNESYKKFKDMKADCGK